MAHDPNLGFADYFSAADASASSVTTLMPAMDEAAPELFGLQAGMELPSSIQLKSEASGLRKTRLLINSLA
ncbi:hypothetical protein, partial [Pseudomonas aeruginosa]|uniref:hypothetical protein n=1 Tax=Pseudomonas aeruginosa TaxID=287 RepID=UPI00406C43F6